MDRATEGLKGWSWEVVGPLENRRVSCQLLSPVFHLMLEDLTREPTTMPLREVRILGA